jgi:hypothetical protein
MSLVRLLRKPGVKAVAERLVMFLSVWHGDKHIVVPARTRVFPSPSAGQGATERGLATILEAIEVRIFNFFRNFTQENPKKVVSKNQPPYSDELDHRHLVNECSGVFDSCGDLFRALV